jgi:D-alanyl-D-alanine carboxypeptidase
MARVARTMAWLTALVMLVVPGVAAAHGSGGPDADRDHRFPQKITAQAEAAVRAAMAEGDWPGAIVHVWEPGRRYTQSFGTTERGRQRSWTTRDRTRIGSLSKTFTATVVLQLVQEGRLSLNDTLDRYSPQVPNAGDITIRELLNMTSGVYDFSVEPAFTQVLFGDPAHRFTPAELVGLALQHPPNFPPGTSWSYSNTNYVLLGQIIERVTGRPLAEELERRIIEPLGLRDTFLATGTQIGDPHVHGYLEDTPAGQTEPEVVDVTRLEVSWAWAAGGIVSSLRDLRVWVRALATGRLLDRKIQDERLQFIPLSPQFVPGSAWSYGLGIGLNQGFLGHNGSVPGYNSIALYSPERRAGVVILINTSPENDVLPDGETVDVDDLFADLTPIFFPDAKHRD